jgi:4-carboxymuconolactone decarboxylase
MPRIEPLSPPYTSEQEPDKPTSLALAERKIVVDRVCARCGCDDEWGVHIASFAREVGLSPEQVASTARGGAEDPAWSQRDRLLARLVGELHDGAAVADELWRALAGARTQTQLLERLVHAGWYHAICYVANGARMEGEPRARLPHG